MLLRLFDSRWHVLILVFDLSVFLNTCHHFSYYYWVTELLSYWANDGTRNPQIAEHLGLVSSCTTTLFLFNLLLNELCVYVLSLSHSIRTFFHYLTQVVLRICLHMSSLRFKWWSTPLLWLCYGNDCYFIIIIVMIGTLLSPASRFAFGQARGGLIICWT